MYDPVPYPDGLTASPHCANCQYWLGGCDANTPSAYCARQGRNTPATDCCVHWVLWVARAQLAEVAQ